MGRLAAALGALILAGAMGGCASSPSRAPRDEIEIGLERGSCMNACPEYTVSITGDGAVTYVGRRNVARRGRMTADIPREEVMALVSAFGRANFFALAEAYARGDVAAPSLTVRLRAGQRAHEVTNSGALSAGPAPPSLAELGAAIDRAAGTARWVGESAAR